MLGTFLLLNLLAGDFAFDLAVRRVESHYQAERLRIPLMGLVSFVSKAGHPFGAKGVKLAVFENVDRGRGDFSLSAADLGSGWRPLVRVRSRGRESTCIYARENGKWWKMLLVTVDGGDATVVQLDVRPDQLLQYVSDSTR